MIFFYPDCTIRYNQISALADGLICDTSLFSLYLKRLTFCTSALDTLPTPHVSRGSLPPFFRHRSDKRILDLFIESGVEMEVAVGVVHFKTFQVERVERLAVVKDECLFIDTFWVTP